MPKCKKQEVVAIIENNGRYWIGSNWSKQEVDECPRKDMPSGTGYEHCVKTCHQDAHAEVDALMQAGEHAKGGTMYVVGHYYSCNDCTRQAMLYGIKEIIVGRLPF